MFLTITDLVLILVLFIFIALGYVRGLLTTVGSLVGTVLGFWIAGKYAHFLAAWLTPYMLGRAGLAATIAFAIVFIAVNQLIGLLLWVITKIFNVISIIPFTKTINRILGGVFGALEGVIVLTAIVFVVHKFVPFPFITTAFENSVVATKLEFLIIITAPWHGLIWQKVTQYAPL